MAGRGRCLDNIFIDLLWRSLTYEEVYLAMTRVLMSSGREFSRTI